MLQGNAVEDRFMSVTLPAQFGSTQFDSTRLGSAQDGRHNIPPSCAPEIDTRSTKSREPSSAATSP
ncbi:hypothetical protein HanHA300_Chr15g0569411 [Helianthus annuus]|nr:hypothetical protein HanHA300_Chr15g0569411 [Helianthus annuus]KAJ0473478.1 hypothetical protein HanHA89_Chr15g0618771 [Helianthus annuus]KAJ0649062.1 hypothetical protein HanLR1_Chr15g0579921 [Helianthus annuus]